jgi:tetratricopeptide (TPR) repeat protein
MRLIILFLAAAQAFHLDIEDARGKKPSGVAVEAGAAGVDNWRKLDIVRAKKDSVIVWPFDSLAAEPDGPGAVQVVVVERGDSKALANPGIAADIATGVVLGRESLEDAAKRTGFDTGALKSSFASLANATDDYAGGVGLLWTKQPARAVDLLARALRERERQLTRVPSDIFPAAMLNAKALFDSGKYDDAAAVYLKAMKLRPSDAGVRKARAEALIKAGKEDAARELLEQAK